MLYHARNRHSCLDETFLGCSCKTRMPLTAAKQSNHILLTGQPPDIISRGIWYPVCDVSGVSRKIEEQCFSFKHFPSDVLVDKCKIVQLSEELT